jgi:hypothetical protein
VAFPALTAIAGIVVMILLHGALRVVGLGGPALAAFYFLQPAWRYAILVDEDAISIASSKDVRLRLLWSDVKEVRAVDATKVCYVDGGEGAKSVLVSGPRAPAPYAVERRAELYDFILAHVAKEKIRLVETLEAR